MVDSLNPLQDLYNFNKQRDAMLQEAANKPQTMFGNVDPVMLAIAGGMFAPTKTGGFGESISNAANAAAGPLKSIRDQQTAAQDRQAQIKEATARLWLQQQKQDREADLGASVEDHARLANAERQYMEQFNVNDPRLRKPDGSFRSPEAEAEYNRRIGLVNQALQPMRDALERRNTRAGYGGAGGSRGGGQGASVDVNSIAKEGIFFLPKSKAEYDAMPPGSPYKAPDGSTKQKPNTNQYPPA